MRSNLDDLRLRNIHIGKGWFLESASFVPADNFVLTVDHPPLLILNPAGAIDVLMPTSTLLRAGLMFLICNPSAFTITLKTDGDAAFTTAITIATLENTIAFCTGNTTQALGWRALATALST